MPFTAPQFISSRGEASPSIDLGLVDYDFAHQLQLRKHAAITLNNASELIIFTEHFPVYTCGRGMPANEKPFGRDIPIVSVERGGGLTYHGPGQIIGYPILDLARRRLSIPQYLRGLEEVLIAALKTFGVIAHYKPEHRAGLWVGTKKIASIGIAVKRWVTFHGFAINVDCDLEPFRKVEPCGLPGSSVSSLKELGFSVGKKELTQIVKEKILKHFF